MENSNRFISIPEFNKKTNFWMVRAKKGFFFDEFVREGYIAIGWNAICKYMLSDNLSKGQYAHLKKLVKDIYNEQIPGTAVNKCMKFCYELTEGDIAVIVDNQRVAFAKIGEYYEVADKSLTAELEKQVHEDIQKAKLHRDHFHCPYVKRRKIEIIRVINEGTAISPYLQSAMARNWHSLSDMNEYAELILSACFDAFIYENKLVATFRVERRGDINVLDLSDFVLNSATLITGNKPQSASVKTTLHSPGDIILQILDFAKENVFWLGLCYIAVFGGKVGDYEFNSLIGIVKNLINKEHNKKKQALELRKLEAETRLAEEAVIAKELENLEKKRSLDLEMSEKCVTPLVNAAKRLQIHPSKATVMDISAIIEKQTNNE